MQHLDEGTIHAWLDGALDAEEAARVEQHAAVCTECAAAIAEARGLAAGASRILASLDDVPGGVIPGAPAAGGSSFSARRSRSLWSTLHLTPVRAAAAALVFVAAGTALVLQHKSDAPARSPIVFAKFDTTTHGRPAATESPVIANGPRKMAPPVPAPMSARAEPKARQHADAAMSAVVATSSQAADSISTAQAPRLTNESANRALVAPAPSPMAVDAAKSAVAAGAAGAQSTALRAATPRSARSMMAPSQTLSTLTPRCYSLDGDSLPLLPRQIVLDTSNVVSSANALQAEQRRSVAVFGAHAVSALVGGVVTPVSSWHWSARPDGISLEMMTPSAMAIQLDSVGTSGDLRGTMSSNGRQLTVLLRRVECPSPR